MMKRKTIFLISLIALLTILSCAPVFAADVCKIGSKNYTSLKKAIAAVKDGQTITILQPIKTTGQISIRNGKTFILNFANKQYTCSADDYAFTVAPGTTVTVKNLKMAAYKAFRVGGTMKIVSGAMSSGYITVDTDKTTAGKLIIQNGTFNITKKQDEGPWLDNYGTLKITGGTFSTAADIRSSKKMTINGGTFTYNGGHSILSNTGGTTVINGGSFSSGKFQSVIAGKGKLVVNGGTFKSKTISVVDAENASVIITGGTFTRTQDGGPGVQFKRAATISGGTFKGGLSLHGNATLNGGKTTHHVVAEPGATVTINKFTVTQSNPPHQGPGWGDACLIANNAKMTVNGGSYTSTNGYGYAAVNGGKVTFGVSSWKSLFNVMKYKF